jgi:hypothetical protein
MDLVYLVGSEHSGIDGGNVMWTSCRRVRYANFRKRVFQSETWGTRPVS